MTIKREFTPRGIPVRPVFLMRDPIERVISSQRMKMRKRGQLSPDEEVESLRSLAKKLPKQVSIRSNYAQTLGALDEDLGHENCFISFYETLFKQKTYANLCKFLDMNYQEPRWGHKINVSATDTLIPEDILEQLGLWQSPIYHAVKSQLTNVNIDSIWSTSANWCGDQ
ncbi:hypothetical protein [Prochlorococcus sp. MIT 1201]|uniref:hypothetical protein n=1 Tax=Prochlorococcus sp. MIT 1201 TaxID=3082535 RepID=UPI0039A6FE3C